MRKKVHWGQAPRNLRERAASKKGGTLNQREGKKIQKEARDHLEKQKSWGPRKKGGLDARGKKMTQKMFFSPKEKT